MMRGRFITLEGGEGAGKSTQVKLLAQWLEAQGREVLATREPGGSAGAEEIRKLLVQGTTDRWDALTETLLHYAARRDHLHRTILPALAAGRWVISDRFSDSTMAYQGYGHGVDRDFIAALDRAVVGEHRPDLTLLLDLPVEQGLRRATARPGHENRYEAMDRAFHERLRQGFLAIAGAEPKRCRVVPATADIDTVQARLRAAVAARFAAELPQTAAG
jgi:dTMP kinase